jgi:hypothetical protein
LRACDWCGSWTDCERCDDPKTRALMDGPDIDNPMDEKQGGHIHACATSHLPYWEDGEFTTSLEGESAEEIWAMIPSLTGVQFRIAEVAMVEAFENVKECDCVVDPEDGSTITACVLHPQGGSPKSKATWAVNKLNDLREETTRIGIKACLGRHYQGDEPCFNPTKIVFHRGLDSEDKVVVEDDGQTDWAAVANRIQALLSQGYDWTTLPCEYCGATELEDVLHCDECGEAVPHGHEHPGIDEDCDDVTYCDGCQPCHDIIDIEHAIEAGADIVDLEELL